MITENKNILFAELVTVRSGIYRKIAPNGEVYLIQKGSFGIDGNPLLLSNLPDLEMEEGFEKHLLTGDEILLTAKGEKNVAYLLPQITVPAVASSVFLVLKMISAEVSSAYLVWYLNTLSGQQTLSRLSRGSGIPSLAKRDIQQIAIPVPPLLIQEKILILAELQRNERDLYQQLIAAKQELAEAQLLQLTHSTISLQSPTL